MFWRILPHATACLASDRLFVLDLRLDRYFQVPDAAAAPMRDWLERHHGCAAPTPVVEMLDRAGMTRRHDPPPTNALREHVPLPMGLDFPRPEAMVSASSQRIRVGRAVAATWLSLRWRPLLGILSDRAVRAPLPMRGHLVAVSAEAARFDQARSFTPIARNCLLDSLALDRWLARHGLGATLVFGISAHPFAAHCWLQTPDLLLNDSYDHVSRFTPILAA